MAEYDTTALAEDVKERGSLPANDARFTSAKILAAATLELREGVAPMLSSSRAEYLVYPYTVAVTVNKPNYRMHPRAVGGTLRNVNWLDTALNPKRLRELSLDEVEKIGATTIGGTPYGYYVRNYEVVLVPIPNVAGSVQMPYYARPNRLVLPNLETGGTIIVAVDVGDTISYEVEFSTSDAADAFVAATSNLGGSGTGTVDAVRATPGFETLAAAATPTTGGINLPTTVFVVLSKSEMTANDYPVAGDYIMVSGAAPVPQAPVELHGLLAARTARRLVKAVGDDRYAALSEDVAELEQKARDWLLQRVAGQTQQAGASIGSSGVGPFGGALWQW